MRHRIDPLRSIHTVLLALILLINILIGGLVVTDYGESWDEYWSYDLAQRSLAAYTSSVHMEVEEDKGPAYFMLALLGADGLRAGWENLSTIEAWHFMHFLSFLLAVFFLYQICCKYMSQMAALGAALLFNTQPLLWGHAWINPKDLPFMAFFLGSVWTGMQLMPTRQETVPVVVPDYPTLARTDWLQASRRRRAMLIGAAALALGILLAPLLADAAIQSWIATLISHVYAEGDAGPLGRFFARLAENKSSIPAELYVRKGLILYRRLMVIAAPLSVVFWLACAVFLFPQTRQRFWQATWRPFIVATLRNFLNPRVLLAALILGFASAIRTLGPASGLLVAFYSLSKRGRKMLPCLLSYLILAGLVTVALWPGLWSAPLNGYIRAFKEASNFPWEGIALFAGIEYPANQLPHSYVPVLLALQFTEPALVLCVVGFGLAVRDFWQSKENRPELALAALWFLVPFTLAVSFMPTMYDNFRQFLFIIPPLFIFAGIGMQKILEGKQHFSNWSWQASSIMRITLGVLILAAALLPGIYWGIVLHPYQYVYYNSLAGGVGGAFRRYEMDYWTTSYKEAAEYLNANAPAGSRIAVWEATFIIEHYAREDLLITDLELVDSPQDFAVLSSRLNKDLYWYTEAPVVFQVGRDGAVFAVVKRLDAQGQP